MNHDNQVISKPEVSSKKFLSIVDGDISFLEGVKNNRSLHLERIQSRFNPVLWVFGPEKRAIYRS